MGPYMKLMRWCSIEEVWAWHRSQLWGLRVLLKSLANTADCGAGEIVVRAGTTSGALDGDEDGTFKKTTGTVKKAGDYIDQDMFDALDVVYIGSCVRVPMCKRRSADVKTLQTG